MSLEVIEHDVLRKRYKDARIHLVLHNAARGGPPLRARAFRADSLDAQLDEAVRTYVNDSRFVQVLGKELVLAKVFDWRKDAFQKDAGSIEAFLARYRDDVVPGEKNKYRYRFLDYDWTLNEAR